MASKLHRFLNGGWNKMSAADTRIYYEGAWHDPCAGPKTLWHYENGTWQKFPCGERVLFSAYPQDFSSIAFVGLLNSDGSVFSENGQTVLPLTTSEHGYGGERDIRAFAFSRDYSTVYGGRTPGLDIGGGNVHRDTFLEPNGGYDGPWVQWDWDPPYLDLPFYFEADVAGDGGFKWLLSDNNGPTATQILFRIFTATFENYRICLYTDSPGSGVNPDGWSLHAAGGISEGEICRIPGHVQEDRWHTVGCKILATGEVILTVDGVSASAGIEAFPGDTVRLVSAGTHGPSVAGPPVGGRNGWGGGWYYIGRMKVGSTDGGNEHLDYSYYNAGYPWQYPFDTGQSFAHYPNMEYSPDTSTKKPYTITIQNGDSSDPDLTDYLSWSYPSFFTLAAIYNDPLSTPGEEIWVLDQSGKRDVTLMDDNRAAWPAGSDRIIKVPAYPSDFSRVKWDAMRWQVSDNHGIDNALIFQREPAETNGALNIFNSVPLSLYRVSIAPSTLGDLILIDSAFDYPQQMNGGPRYQRPDGGFTPSGDRIWILRDATTSGATLLYCARDGSGKASVTIPNIDSTHSTLNIGRVDFDPDDETIFFYTGTNSIGTVYHGIWKGNLNGDPFVLVYEIPGAGLHPPDRPYSTTPIVETFTYSDGDFGDRNTGRWQNLVIPEAQIISNQLATMLAAGLATGNVPIIGIDTSTGPFVQSEAYATFYYTVGAQVSYATLAACAQIANPAVGGDTIRDGYVVWWTPGGQIIVWRWSGGVQTLLGSSSVVGWASGTTLGIRVTQQTGYKRIDMFKNGTLVQSRFDFGSSLGAGYIGVGMKDNRSSIQPDSGLRADNFGGGEYIPTPLGDPHTVNNIVKISPDKTRLAFLLNNDSTGNVNVCSMLKDGSDFRNHTNDVYPGSADGLFEFGWSPDGSEIGFWTFSNAYPDQQGFGAVKIADDTQREILAPGAMFQSWEINDFQWFHGWQGE
jgi:hypothetical protein